MPTFNSTRANYSVRELMGISALWILGLLPLMMFSHLGTQTSMCRIKSKPDNFANLGRTKKLDVIKKIVVFVLFIFNSYFLPHFQPAGLFKITVNQSLRLRKPCKAAVHFKPLKMTRFCRRQMKYNCPVNWDLISWLRVPELQSICSCRGLFHLDEVSRVELNNGGKYQPSSFNWLQPEWNYRHICIQHSGWNDKLFGLTAVNGEFHWHFLHDSS